MSKQLPNELYVYMEEDGEDVYAVAAATLRECGDMDESREVGRYILHTKGTLQMEHSFVTAAENVQDG